jgi:membrane-bound ClpP family serine protease
MDFEHYAALLAIAGLALIVAEIFIPSGGLILIAAVLSLIASIWCSWEAWNETLGYFWTFLGALVLLIPAALIGAFYYFPRTEFGRRILLEAQSLEELTPFAEEEAFLSQLIGRTGTTLTMLNPGGLVLVENERMHCESRGMLIDPNTNVEVIAVKGNRLVVRIQTQRQDSEEDQDAPNQSHGQDAQAPEESQMTDADQSDEFSPESKEKPLDFDIPQS